MSQIVHGDVEDAFYFHLHHLVCEYERIRHGELLDALTSSVAEASPPPAAHKVPEERNVAAGASALADCGSIALKEPDDEMRTSQAVLDPGAPHLVSKTKTTTLESVRGDIHASLHEQIGDTDVPEALDEEEERIQLHHSSLKGSPGASKTPGIPDDTKHMFAALACKHTGLITASSAFDMMQESGLTADYNTLLLALKQVGLCDGPVTWSALDQDETPVVTIK
eukprot:TRINITY_DN50509_c0_g1_i1.p1 TRINITY_DN50509_c0_g1~~TRINITY_DN50509_c0_g1_i1.p1  ORF type:complete len:224 (-),score=44.68 TRINITY_DN50509_c0_g1_i1:38-709(-)